jgi:hypothetical protein
VLKAKECMPITVCIESEAFGREGSPWFHSGLDEALRNANEDTTCLQFIDPYGDTVFNQLQLRVLIVELMAHRLDLAGAAGAALDELIPMLKRVEGHVHTYVRFIGD